MHYFGWLVLSFICVIVTATVVHWKWPSWYFRNLINIRKTAYTVFVLVYGALILSGHILLNDWVSAVQFASMSVFLDLAILETPSILKIGNAEFKKNDLEIERTIKNNQRTILQSVQKAELFTEVVQYTDVYYEAHLENINPDEWHEYLKQLKTFLYQYTDTFHFKLSITQFVSDADMERRKMNLTGALLDIERYHCFTLTSDEKKTLIENLAAGAVYELKEQEMICVPFYGVTHSIIISVQGKSDESLVNVLDALHVLNLTTIFEWFLYR